jgi:phosphoribosylamine---glycine ligase
MYSKCGEGAGLLKRIQDEGNNCSLYIEDKDYASVYNGILDNSNSPEEGDIIIFDSSGSGARADSLREFGFKVFGASKFHDKLENNREFGLSFMEENGIMIPKTKSFDNFNNGIKFIKENHKKRYVFKPSGKDLPTKLTYSSSDMEDLLFYMKFVEKNFGEDIENFVLQEFIEGAIISTEYWVGKYGFIEPVNHTIEVKKLMNNDLGPSTGCSGNIVWRGEEDSSLAELLHSVEQELISNNYIGPIDINCIVNEKGIYGLEWTPRFGLDAMPTLLQLIEGDIGKIIHDLASGYSPEMELSDFFAGGVRLTIPPYPIEPNNLKLLQKDSPNEGIPIRGLEDCESLCYFYEVKKEENQLVHSAGTGVIACISDVGMNPKSTFDCPYDILKECKIPDKMYRTDLNKILPKMYSEVKETLDAVWA